MRHMRLMRQFGRTAKNICFVEKILYKTNITGCIWAIFPHKSSFASLNGVLVYTFIGKSI